MPPRPPVTTLVIHTWKEHGKPRPLSNHEHSTQAARDRISRSLSYDAQLTNHVRTPSLEDELVNPRIPVVMRSTSFEEGLHLKKCTPVTMSPISTSTEEESDTLGLPPLLPRCISSHECDTTISEIANISETPENTQQKHIALPPRPKEWPLCNRFRRGRGAVLFAGPPSGKARRIRARSVGASREFRSTLLGESLIQGSSSFDAGLSDIATRGIVHSGISQNV